MPAIEAVPEQAKDVSLSEGSRILQLVTFGIGGEEYGVDILRVQEINRMTEITDVPNSPSYIEGVMNLRGKVIPVVNLRKKFGMPEKEADETTRIIILGIHGVTMGVMVDSVSEVLRISSSIVEPAPKIVGGISSEYIKGIAKLERRLIMLLDLDDLVSCSGEGTATIGCD